MKVLSICSGIAADAVAWSTLGWEHVAFAEIAPFPSKVLAQRWPSVPNLGDFTKVRADDVAAIDLLVGGTPCQSFSLAGLRGGMDDDRGLLALEFLRLAARTRPRWIVWENVPGVLSADRGRAFGTFLGGLEALGYGWAYRVLDAQYFGLAQRRARVFVVGCARGSWQRASAALLERSCLRGDPAPRRATREDVAGCLESRAGKGGYGSDAHGAATGLIAFDTTQITHPENRSKCDPGGPAPALARGGHAPAIAFHQTQDPITGAELAPAITRTSMGMGMGMGSLVRRLIPVECERLMGFPDDYTAIVVREKRGNRAAQIAKDGPRYAALGNSIAVTVLRWLGRRIDRVDALVAQRAA